MTAAPVRGLLDLSGRVTNSRHGLEDHDTTVLLGVVVTPIVGIRGPTQLPGVESEGCRVRGVGVGLHDVPSKDAEHDAVARPRTDPPQGADGAPCGGMWKWTRGIVADGPRGFAVHTAVILIVSNVPRFCHLQRIAISCNEVERGVVVVRRRRALGQPRRTRAWYCPMSRSDHTRPITNEPHDRRGGVVRRPWG
jgi:hypothetical protein